MFFWPRLRSIGEFDIFLDQKCNLYGNKSSFQSWPCYASIFDGLFFAPPYVALATAQNFQMCKNSLNMMLNVQLFRMRPITAILVHRFKRYWFLAAPVSDRNTGEGYISYNRWRIQGEFRAVGPPKTQSSLFAPPPPNGWSVWVFLQL